MYKIFFMAYIFKFVVPLFIILFFQATSNCQNKRQISPKLMSVYDVFRLNQSTKTQWSLYYEHSNMKYKPYYSEEVINDLDLFLLNRPIEDRRNGEIAEFELIKEYRPNLERVFSGFKIFGSNELAEFLYSKGIEIPVRFCTSRDTLLSVIFTGIAVGKLLNTLKLTSKQRASKIITEYILPSLNKISEPFVNTKIQYIGITCLFGSKDFLDKSPLAIKPEYLALLVPLKLISDFINGKITDQELLDSSDVYVNDRDMNISQIKKIKVTLE